MLLLRGTEVHTLEMTGRVDASALRSRMPAHDSITLVSDDGRASVGLLFFDIRGLHMRGVPVPRFSYAEALWRILVEYRGQRAWWAVCCDVDSWAVEKMGGRLLRYPVRTAPVTVHDGKRWTIQHGENRWEVDATTEEGAVTTANPVLPVVVTQRGRWFRVPWGEESRGPIRQTHIQAPTDNGAFEKLTLGAAVNWDATASAQQGRIHKCGFASGA